MAPPPPPRFLSEDEEPEEARPVSRKGRRRPAADPFDDSSMEPELVGAPARPKFAELAEESAYTPLPARSLVPAWQRCRSRGGGRRTAPPAGRRLVRRGYVRRGTGTGRAGIHAQAPVLVGFEKHPRGFHNGNRCHPFRTREPQLEISRNRGTKVKCCRSHCFGMATTIFAV